MDLSTTYMGLELKNPFVPSSSPLTKRLDPARQLEDAGASALVMYLSLIHISEPTRPY